MKIKNPEDRFKTQCWNPCSQAGLAAEFENIIANPVIWKNKKFFHSVLLHCIKTESDLRLSKDGEIKCKNFSKGICGKVGEACINTEFDDDTTMKRDHSKF